MPLPTVSTRNTAAQVIAEAKTLRSMAQDAISKMGSGPVSANAVLQLCQRLNASKANLIAPAQGNPAVVAALAQDLGLANPVETTAAMQGVLDAVTATIGWVVANFPAAGGFILKDTLNADGSVSVRAFSSAQTAGLRVELQKIVDAIS